MSIPDPDHRGRTQHRDQRGLAAPSTLQHGLDGQEVADQTVAGRLVGAREGVGVVDDGTVGPRTVHDGGPDRHDVPRTDGPRGAQDALRVRDDGRLALATPLDRRRDEVARVRDEHHDARAGQRVLRVVGRELVDRPDVLAPRGRDRGRDGSAADDDDLVGRLARRCRVRRPRRRATATSRAAP